MYIPVVLNCILICVGGCDGRLILTCCATFAKDGIATLTFNHHDFFKSNLYKMYDISERNMRKNSLPC